MKYVAFLLGINVGGNRKVAMEDLRKIFSSLGFTDVKTLLNSGNVIFETEEKNEEKLTLLIEEGIKKELGIEVKIILRTIQKLQELVDSDPFTGIEVAPNTRLYITFLAEKPTTDLEIPYETPEKDYKILKLTQGEVISVLTLNPQRKTTDAMNILARGFGKHMTTRNWNTIQKILKK